MTDRKNNRGRQYFFWNQCANSSTSNVSTISIFTADQPCFLCNLHVSGSAIGFALNATSVSGSASTTLGLCSLPDGQTPQMVFANGSNTSWTGSGIAINNLLRGDSKLLWWKHSVEPRFDSTGLVGGGSTHHWNHKLVERFPLMLKKGDQVILTYASVSHFGAPTTNLMRLRGMVSFQLTMW